MASWSNLSVEELGELIEIKRRNWHLLWDSDLVQGLSGKLGCTGGLLRQIEYLERLLLRKSDIKETVEPLDEEIKTVLKVKRGQHIVPKIKPESTKNTKEENK